MIKILMHPTGQTTTLVSGYFAVSVQDKWLLKLKIFWWEKSDITFSHEGW